MGYELIVGFCENVNESAGTADVGNLRTADAGNLLSSRAIGSLVTVASVMDCGSHICHLN